MKPADPFPTDDIMLALVAHLAGDTFAVADGVLTLTVRSEGREVVAPQGALDELEGRKWVRVRADGETVATDAGKYWAKRWLVKRLGKGRLKSVRELRVTGR